MSLSEVAPSVKRDFPEQFVRPFTPLHEEIRRGLKLAATRFGKSPSGTFKL